MQVQYQIILRINQDAHPNTQRATTFSSGLTSCPLTDGLLYWPCAARQKGLLTLLTRTAKESSPKPLGQRRMMSRSRVPSVAVGMGVRHQLIMRWVSGAGLGSSLETATWDCHPAIKSIIFHIRSQYLEWWSSNGMQRSDGHYIRVMAIVCEKTMGERVSTDKRFTTQAQGSIRTDTMTIKTPKCNAFLPSHNRKKYSHTRT